MLFALIFGFFFAILATLFLRFESSKTGVDLPLADLIDQLLPQTQCGECGFAGCRPYAEAISRNSVPINQCPPGGTSTIQHLASLLGRDVIPLNPVFGKHRPFRVAVIEEDQCIGCTKCIQACPVDAILGAAKQMHTVIADYCTGCELCMPPCPVDCIRMQPSGSDAQAA